MPGMRCTHECSPAPQIRDEGCRLYRLSIPTGLSKGEASYKLHRPSANQGTARVSCRPVARQRLHQRPQMQHLHCHRGMVRAEMYLQEKWRFYQSVESVSGVVTRFEFSVLQLQYNLYSLLSPSCCWDPRLRAYIFSARTAQKTPFIILAPRRKRRSSIS
jgi:hypothetical protein